VTEDKKPRKKPEKVDFTDAQRLAIQPYLDRLIARYHEVAETGGTSLPDPICVDVPRGRCYECPVFGEGARKNWLHCEAVGFFPTMPWTMEDNGECIRVPGGKKLPVQARKWGAAMVERLERLRLKPQ
jgi:hypothetical protein